MAEITGDPRIRCNSAGMLGFLEATVGDLETAITCCLEAVDLAPEPYERALAVGWLGFAHLQRGDGPQAVAMLEEADRMATAYGSRHGQALFKAYLADAYCAVNRFDAAETLTRQAQDMARDGVYPSWPPRPSAPPAASPWREAQRRRRGSTSRRRSGPSLRSRCGSRLRAPT